MKLALVVLITVFSSSAFANVAINPDWSYAVGDASKGDDRGIRWVLQSKHPERDITLVMVLTARQGESGVANGWTLGYLFGPKEEDPKLIENLEVRANRDSRVLDIPRQIDGRFIVSTPMPSDIIEALHDSLFTGATTNKAVKRITLRYFTPKTYDRSKPAFGQGLFVNFDMRRWDKKYHELLKDAESRGAGSLLVTRKQMKRWPISKLPEWMRPKPSDTLDAAKRAGIGIDEAYAMSINELERAVNAAEIDKRMDAWMLSVTPDEEPHH